MRRSALPVVAAFLIATACDSTVPSPTAPGNLAATLSAPTTVQLSWSANPNSQEIDKYIVYRSGREIGQTDVTSFTDANLRENASLSYSVAAAARSGLVSDTSSAVTITTRDATPPKVIQTFPADGTGPLPVENILVRLVFNEAMDSASINASTLTLKVGPTGERIPGAIIYNSHVGFVDFHPTNTMPPSTTIVVTANTGIKDAAGNGLVAPYSFSFTTTDNTAPRIISTFPADGATGVPPSVTIKIVFSKLMKLSSLATRVFDLSSNLPGDFAQAIATYDSVTNTQSLQAGLKSLHTYEVVVGPNFPAMDASSNRLAGPNSFRFTTLDLGPPKVVTSDPAPNATDVDPSKPIRITFSEALDPATVGDKNFTVYDANGAGMVGGTVSYDAATFSAVFTPSAPLSASTRYGVGINGIRDATGVPMEDFFGYLFTTR
jgi:hypothetical protein